MEMSASSVTDKINQVMGPWEEKIAPVRESVDDLDSRVRSIVRGNPALSLFGALCIGYLIGRVIAKR